MSAYWGIQKVIVTSGTIYVLEWSGLLEIVIPNDDHVCVKVMIHPVFGRESTIWRFIQIPHCAYKNGSPAQKSSQTRESTNELEPMPLEIITDLKQKTARNNVLRPLTRPR